MPCKHFMSFAIAASIAVTSASAQKTNPIPTQRDSAGIQIK